jgi:hypothetical protein
MPRINELSPADVNRYFITYFATWDNLQNDRANLERRRLAADATSDELNEIEVKLLWIASEHAKLKLRRIAFINGLVAITPPDDALVARVKDLTAQSEKLTNNSVGAQNAIKLAAAALAQFNAIQPSST